MIKYIQTENEQEHFDGFDAKDVRNFLNLLKSKCNEI